MTTLPIFEDIEIDRLTLIDFRSINDRDKNFARLIQEASLDRYPIDLLCDCGFVRRKDKKVARKRAIINNVVDEQKFQDELQDLLRLNTIRHTKAIFDGTVDSLNFAIYKNSKLIGAIQWYGLHLVRSIPPQKDIFRGGYFPAFENDVTDETINNRTLKIVLFFLKNDLLMQDRRLFDLQQVAIPRIDIIREDTNLQNQGFELFEAAALANDIKIDSKSDPTQPGRERVRLVDRNKPFIREPEIEQVIFDRTGKELGD